MLAAPRAARDTRSDSDRTRDPADARGYFLPGESDARQCSTTSDQTAEATQARRQVREERFL